MTAAYLHNRLPNSLTGDKTPYEIFHQQKPNLDVLRSFGATAFVHIHQGQRAPGKLEDRARKCIMIGYIEGGKGWMFYDEKSKTVFPSAIAKFPYEAEDVTSEQQASSKMPDAASVRDGSKKGSLENIMNALTIGDFATELRIDKQDVAVSNALQDGDELKLLSPPQSYAEAMGSNKAEQWRVACDAEMNMMKTMNVWRVVDKPDGMVPIDLKWVFTYKKVDEQGNPVKFKACLVAKGFRQREGINYQETFAPTATFAGLRILLTIAAIK